MKRRGTEPEIAIPESVDSAGRERMIWWICLALGLVVLVIHNVLISPWMLDDAFISFRYSENFANGDGLVFNVGERVEGYTTFLWVFLLGIGHWLGAETILLGKVLAWVFALAIVGIVAFSYKFAEGVSKTVSSVATLLLCNCGIFTPWPSSGMEVTLFGFLILTTLALYSSKIAFGPTRQHLLAGISATLLVMTRPEGILLVAILSLHSLYRFLMRKDRAVVWFVLSFAVIYGAYFGWRYSYYGYLLPNTFYAKVGSSGEQLLRGLEYLKGMGILIWPMLLLAIVALWRSPLRGTLLLRVTAIYLLVHIIYIWLVGGDCMPAFRFIAPLLPLLAVLAAVGLMAISHGKVTVILAVLCVAFNLYQMFFAFSITGHIKADKVAVRGKEVGLWLKENLPPGSLIATNTAGTIPYYSGLPVVDMLGLNDVTIAHRAVADMGTGLAGHEKGDGAYVLSRNPAVIQFHSSLGRLKPSFRSDRELFEMPEFHMRYHAVEVMIPTLRESAVFYVRDDISLSFLKR